VPVSEIFYSQHNISPCFSGGDHKGESLDRLIAELLEKKVVPSFFTLHCAKFRGRYFSLNNRRLYCLKSYANMLDDQKAQEVSVYVNEHPLDYFTARFISSFSTGNNGESVFIIAEQEAKQEAEAAGG